ncbi:MAG: hypothetical protein EBR02_08465 [Alphaproteobacteria bacterium]|nr:hypothetical protein [Alphaproteobacteria bacterium]
MSHKLTPKQNRALYLLAQGKTAIDVAATLKLRRETLSRWKKNPEFNEAFERIMEVQREGLKHQLTHLITNAIDIVNYGVTNHDCSENCLQGALSLLKLIGIADFIAPNASEKSQ